MRVAVVCVVLSLAALAYSQRPAPCTAPAKWTGRTFQRDRNRRFEDTGRLVYDASGQRILYIFEELEPERDVVYDLMLFKEKKRYMLDRNTMKCTVTDLTDDFKPIQIPNNATFVDKFVLGSNGEADSGVTVVQWMGNTTNPSGEYFIQVTDTGCIPVNEFFYDEESGDVFETFFVDVILGFDPDAFIPPKECGSLDT